MRVDDNMVKLDAEIQFQELKKILIELESRGYRPMVVTHHNGMLDTLRIADAHPTTPEVDRIRAERKAESPAYAA